MKTTKEQRAELRARTPTSQQSMYQLYVRRAELHAVLDDLDEVEARAERYREVLVMFMAKYGQHCGSCCRLDGAGKIITPEDACVCNLEVKAGRAALAETAPKTSETTGNQGAPGVSSQTSGPEAPQEGTSSPDDAERAAREWLDRWYGAGRLTVAHVKTLAALLVQAREAGRVEGIEQVRFELCGVGGLFDSLTRPDRAKGG